MNSATKHQPPNIWRPQQSANLYNVGGWSNGHFKVTDNGNLAVSIKHNNSSSEINLIDLIEGIKERGLLMPALVHIENILDAQITNINNSFAAAIAALEYQGKYQGVFPVKVNQKSQIIEKIVTFGASFNYGLEVGSKAELLMALATIEPFSGYIICNGHKDEEFINLVLGAQKLGYQIFFVVETPTELPLLIKCSQALNISPRIGVRIKPSSVVSGHWHSTSGDRSIFGLTSTQLINMIELLKHHNMLHCMQLLHVHLGSQIPNLIDIRTGVEEACRYYLNLVAEGAPMGHIDLGGGLAVDYEGTSSNNTNSKNYSLTQYCHSIVEVIINTLKPNGVAHPNIITESGRALVAYSSVLLFNILDVTVFEAAPLPINIPKYEHDLIHRLQAILQDIQLNKILECYNTTLKYRDEMRNLFQHGQINLHSCSLAENIVLAIMQKIHLLTTNSKPQHPKLAGLTEFLADIYYGNFSIFQSLPDIWAIDQLFPIMPIHRLDERPDRNAIIADITCDCDGKINKFACNNGLQTTLPLHSIKTNEEYYLGVFLVGAYQETLGDLHNLLGDTNIANISIGTDGSINYLTEVEGDTAADVLSYVEHNPKSLIEHFRKIAEKGVAQGLITATDKNILLANYIAGMRGYTYFER